MANPLLACFGCGAQPPVGRRTWQRCERCAELNLPSTYFCGKECMTASWPRHKQYHKLQKEHALSYPDSVDELCRAVANKNAQLAEETGDEYIKIGADAQALATEGDLHGAVKAFRKCIKMCPERPDAYHSLALSLERSYSQVEAAQMYLKAMDLYEDDTAPWAGAAAGAFGTLNCQDPPSIGPTPLMGCKPLRVADKVPLPVWWNDQGIKALSARVVAAAAPEDWPAYSMRGFALAGEALGLQSAHWGESLRTPEEMKEAATWFRRSDARKEQTPRGDDPKEGWNGVDFAAQCDRVADILIAHNESEAATARAAAEAEKKAALEVAEAKAQAAAEELLAEEEQEKHQQVAASNKGGKKKGNGKKGKGRR
tara:strand:- start:323 stop:1432 length:1110 start_codon:yes stop_codon:yes gene_type:complete